MADGGIDQSNENLPVNMAAMAERNYVAAIDLGTTYSGCAFGKRKEIEEDALNVTVFNLSGDGAHRHMSRKIPTSILFDKEGTFVAFGHEAEEKFAHLLSEGHEWDFFLIRRFKMMLYGEEDLTKRTKLSDVKNREFPAFKVFTESIRFLKDQLLEHIDSDVDSSEIHWVLTVPAIWGDRAKQFMRQSAVEAGIETDNLSLALEPEAASIFCKNIPLARISFSGSPEVKHFAVGDKYIVLDLGGGTTDITVHKVQGDGTLKEIMKANGGAWGGTAVDDNFIKLLEETIGADVMEIFQNRFGEECLEMYQEFEVTKRTVGPEKTGAIRITLPQIVLEQFKELNNKSLESINGSDRSRNGQIQIRGDKLMIEADYFRVLFKDAGEHICEAVRNIIMEVNDDELNKLLLVGGFGESSLMHNKLKTNFPELTIIIPEDAGLAVLKGAVLFGFNPTLITTRVCRKTYGIQTHKHFEPALDPPERRIVIRQSVLCKDAFGVHAEINQEFEVDEKSSPREYVPSDPGKKKLVLNVLASEDEWPKYADSPDVQVLGQLIVDLEDDDETNAKPIEVQMQFGRTELGVVAREKRTGREFSANYDFLGGANGS